MEALAGIGPGRAQRYASAGIHTVRDLLLHLPRSYRRFAPPRPISALEPGVPQVIRATVRRVRGPGRRTRRGAIQLRLEDGSGVVDAVLFGPSYRAGSMAVGSCHRFLGTLRGGAGTRSFQIRESVREDESFGREQELWQPVYELPEGIPPRTHRRCVQGALRQLAGLLDRVHPELADPTVEAPALGRILRDLHAPDGAEPVARARQYLAWEDAVRLQWGLLRLRRVRSRRTRGYQDLAGSAEAWRRCLPFALHADQDRALEAVQADLASDRAMSRLLTGDVGSGKTAVALFPAVAAARAGRQAVVLAPTEILARQHHRWLGARAADLGLPAPTLVVAGERLAGSHLEAARHRMLVGTHRLVGRSLTFEDLAAVVVDEQHKFGVRQRFTLWGKGRQPDLLLVSATPIPRTLALTLFGHMEVSTLGARPDAQRCVETVLMLGDERRNLVPRLAEELAGDGRVFVVCPSIQRGSGRLAAAEEVGPWLQERLGTEVPVLHGRLGQDRREQHLAEFAAGRVRVLVATTVVEVGIDVPEASLVAVLDADRFGLSQLHQIRGRVGRQGQPVRCLLVTADPGERARRRLEAFAAEDDGFRVARADLEQRGPGEVLGLAQHGLFRSLAPESLFDADLHQRARARAEALLEQRKRMTDKRFERLGVASQGWIW